MKLLSRQTMRGAATVAMAMGAGVAQAHTGHDTTSLFAGLAHPVAPDHLLAAVAVGIWSVVALPEGRTSWGPAAFLAALATGAALAAAGLGVQFAEQGIALSVVLFGVMLVMACRGRAAGAGAGLALVAAGGLMHGMAHGAQAPAAAFAGYAVGFVATTAALHFAGVLGGVALRRCSAGRARAILASLGGLLGGAGVYLFSLA